MDAPELYSQSVQASAGHRTMGTQAEKFGVEIPVQTDEQNLPELPPQEPAAPTRSKKWGPKLVSSYGQTFTGPVRQVQERGRREAQGRRHGWN